METNRSALRDVALVLMLGLCDAGIILVCAAIGTFKSGVLALALVALLPVFTLRDKERRFRDRFLLVQMGFMLGVLICMAVLDLKELSERSFLLTFEDLPTVVKGCLFRWSLGLPSALLGAALSERNGFKEFDRTAASSMDAARS